MDDESTKKSALFIAILSSFLTPFMGSSINLALPSIQQEFQIDAIVLSWIPTAYLLAVAVSLVPFGRLADLYGRKRIFKYGMIIFTITSLLSGIATSAPMLIFFRFCQGVGSAMFFATGIAILTSVFPPNERGKVLGINVTAVYVGLSTGPFLGGFLTQHLTWRSIFIATIPIGLAVIILIAWRLKGEWAEARGEKFDYSGALIYGLSIISLIYGLTHLPGLSGFWLIVIGIGGILVFIRWELKLEHPVFQVRLFRTNKVFAFSNLAALINYCATFAVTFLLSLYLQTVKALDPQAAGLVLIMQPIMMALFSPYAGRLSDKVEPLIVASIGMALSALALLLLTFINGDTSLAFILINLFLLGIGAALFSSPNTNAIMGSVEKKFYGIASGSVGTMRVIGQMLSMGIATLIFALFIGRVQITPEYYPAFIKSVKVAFLISFILCVGGTFASMVRGKVR